MVVEQLDVNTFQKNIWIETTIHKVAPSTYKCGEITPIMGNWRYFTAFQGSHNSISNWLVGAHLAAEKINPHPFLGGGFNPSQTYSSNW